MELYQAPPPPATIFPIDPLPAFSVVSDIVGLLSLSFGRADLLLVLGLDAWARSKKKKTHWISGDSFVLGALSLQLLGLFFRPSTSGFTDELIIDYNVMLLNRGRRVRMCVFFGILLSDIARSRDRNVWSDMLASSVSAAGVLIHLSYEIYILYPLSYSSPSFSNKLYMLVSNIIIFPSIVLLVHLLGCAVLASKSIQELVTQRIPVVLSRTGYRNPRSVVLWEAVEEYAVRSWIAARTHQPHYIIARSVLSSSVGFLVTVCIAVSLLGLETNRYEVQGDRLDWLRVMAITVQWIFILLGWAIGCYRWVTAVVYFPRVMKGPGFGAYFRGEDFWKTAMLEIQEELMKLDAESVRKFSYLRRFLLRLFKKLRLYKFLPTLLSLQIFLVLLSKTSWLISEMVFSNRYMRRFLMGRAGDVEFLAVYNLHNSGGATGPGNPHDFVRYSDVLMHMSEENPAGVCIVNRKSIHEMKSQLKKGEYDGKNCEALISLLQKATRENLSSTVSFAMSLRRNLGDFTVGKSSSKMMVVSHLAIIIELSALYQHSGASSVGPPTDTVNDSIEACCQAWKIMELVEQSDSEAVAVNKQADKIFHSLKESCSWMGLALPINNFQARTVEAAKRALRGLVEKGKQTANTGYESKNWKTIIAGNSLYKLCDSMKDYSVNAEELLNGIQSSLGDVIRSCIFKMGEIIVDECRLWAEAFMEDEPWDALYEARRAK